MSQDKEKTVDVKIKDGSEEKTIKITVKKPSGAVLAQAQRIASKSWSDCVRDGIMTKRELSKFMKEQGIWDRGKDKEQEKISTEIMALEKQLYIGDGKHNKLKASEARDIAIDMRKKRIELRELIAEKMALEQNTAESISDNARFDYLVANCTFHEGGNKVYNSLEEYNEKSDGEIAFAAATAMAQMIYSIDKDFEAKLPENKFLKEYNFVNDDLSLVNDKNETVDIEGRRINNLGQYINDEGKRTDKDGNILDENGNYIPSVVYVDDKGKKISHSS